MLLGARGLWEQSPELLGTTSSIQTQLPPGSLPGLVEACGFQHSLQLIQ